MRNKIDVYACVGGAVYVKYEVSTAPLSEAEQKENHLVVLTSDQIDKIRERNGAFFVYNHFRNKHIQDHGKDYYESTRPYRSGYLVALLKDVMDAYSSAADYVAEHTDQRASMKVWVRLSRRVAFGVAQTLCAMGIEASERMTNPSDPSDAFANWRRVVVPELVCAREVVHFSFDPLSEMRQRMEIVMLGIHGSGVVLGNDVVRHYRATSGVPATEPVVSFDNLFKDESDMSYTVRPSEKNASDMVVKGDSPDVMFATRRWPRGLEEPVEFEEV